MRTFKKRIKGSTYYIDRDGEVYDDKGVVCNQRLNSNGYWSVPIIWKGERKVKNVHRLLGVAFISNPNNKPMVLHKDDVRSNKDLDNLYWGDHKDNMKDAVKNEKYNNSGYIQNRKSYKGIGNPSAKLTNEQVFEIQRDLNREFTISSIAIFYGVSRGVIQHIKHERSWKHIR